MKVEYAMGRRWEVEEETPTNTIINEPDCMVGLKRCPSCGKTFTKRVSGCDSCHRSFCC